MWDLCIESLVVAAVVLLRLLLILFAECVVEPLLACDIIFSTREVVSRTTFDKSISGRSSVVWMCAAWIRWKKKVKKQITISKSTLFNFISNNYNKEEKIFISRTWPPFINWRILISCCVWSTFLLITF